MPYLGGMGLELTRVSFPVEVVIWIAVALELDSQIFTSRAVREWNMVVGNVVEEMDLVLVEQKTGSDGVDWSVAPALIEEAAVAIEGLEEVDVGI